MSTMSTACLAMRNLSWLNQPLLVLVIFHKEILPGSAITYNDVILFNVINIITVTLMLFN